MTPKHDAGLLGQAALAWDAANGVPLKVAISAAGSSSPVLALEVTDITYGAVDASALSVAAPAGRQGRRPRLAQRRQGGQQRPRRARGGADRRAGRRAVHARRARHARGPAAHRRPPRADRDQAAALVTYGQGLGAIAVLERQAGAPAKDPGPLGSLPSVTIDGATGHELPTALGTVIAVDRGKLSYVLLGSLPPNAAEAALREVLR